MILFVFTKLDLTKNDGNSENRYFSNLKRITSSKNG